jgi:hypothetical protein
MTDTASAPADPATVNAMADRLRSVHVTLLFIAVLLCVMVGLNILLITAD